ncbi:MAG TPA: hypothetical protein DCY00_07480 [Actinobacteria bacterium]|nr:hypothetical protein [Actinomycetota bacterium]
MKKLTKESEKLIEDFEKAVRDNHYEEGDPYVEDEEKLEQKYEDTKQALITRLWSLEHKIKRLQAKGF